MLHINRSQHPVLAFLFATLFFFATAPLSWARADNSTDIPSRADVQSQLDTLSKQKDLSPQEKLIQQDLMETLESIDKTERVKAETAQLRQKVAQAPDAMRKATDALSALSDVDNDDETRKTLATLSLRQLESRVAQLLDDLQTAQADLATYNSQLVSLQTQPELTVEFQGRSGSLRDRKQTCRWR